MDRFPNFVQILFMIPYLQVEGLTRYWGESVLFENISFTIGQGQKVALIAKNGAGKTTLMETIIGKDLPDSGKITFTNGITVGYLSQYPVLNPELSVKEEVFNSTSSIVNAVKIYEEAIKGDNKEILQAAIETMDHLNAWDFENKIKQILTQLRIDDFNKMVNTLSGGQQKRVSLANVLINEPDLLILDEPTNHLDLDMIEWLEEYLLKTKSTLLMVTHDRYFLDRVCDTILELDNNSVFQYKGNYSYYIEKRQVRQEMLQAEVEKARNLMRKELEWMRRMPKARSTKAKYRIDSFYQLKEKASVNLSDEELSLKIKASRLGNKVIDIYDLNKKYGDLTVLKNFTYKFARFEKIGIVGDNGTGKSTFLNMITGCIKPDSGKIETGETVKFGYYKQEGIKFSPEDRVIDIIQDIAEYIDLGNGNKWSASQLLNHFLFSYDAQYTKVEKLSGGEKRRLYLCTVLMENPNFLILDEPTNDLDIMTLNVLEDYLQNFNGCVIIVSHDRYFMDKIVDHLFVFGDNGEVKNFPGNYSIYRQWRDDNDSRADKVEQQDKKAVKSDKTPVKNNARLTFNEKRELELLEKDISELENEKNNLENLMSSGSSDHEEIQKISIRYNEIKELLEEKEMRWLELSEKS